MPTPPTLTTLVNFDGADGQYPLSGLFFDSVGNLVGTTIYGGADDEGSVFEIAKTADGYADTPTTLVSFDGNNGAYPYAVLVADAAGDLFGTTEGMGFHKETASNGTVFEIANTANGYASAATTLASITGAGGTNPGGGLILDGSGDLFGTTAYGGADGDGVAFEIAMTANGYASTPMTLVSFNGADGENPTAGLIADAAGDLFGTTLNGGSNGDGVVFEIPKTTNGYASTPMTLVSFNGADGENPTAGLVADAAGDLFGTTFKGGSNGDGVVFEIVKTAGGYASTPTTLVSFDGANGANPVAGLIIDAAGDLFGVTTMGGTNGDGTVFEVASTAGGYSTTPTTLVTFNGSNGSNPSGSLIADAAGDLFGTTLEGGTNNDGVAFELTGAGFQLASPTDVMDTPASGKLGPGATISITLGFNYAVTVTGAPTLSLNDGGTATYSGGSGTNSLTFSYTVAATDSEVASLAVSAVNLAGGASIVDDGGNNAVLSLTGISQSGPQIEGPQDALTAAFTNVLFASPTSTLATTPTITVAGGGSVTNPIYTDAQTLPTLVSEVVGGQITLAQALNTIEHYGDESTTVATIAYQFFTGATPSAGGYGYLVNGGTNPNDLDSAYYAKFSEQNRFINFAANLGKNGAGEAAFTAAYGSLDLADTMTQAYTEIFGFAPAAGKIAAILDATVGTNETREQYFEFYGTDGADGIGTKAAAVGWLMTVAVQADLGAYTAANDGFLAALAAGNAEFNVNLLGAYPTETASQAAATVAFLEGGGQSLSALTNPLEVADSGANVAANLDALQSLAAASELTSITLTDVTIPRLAISALQASSDAQALGDISSPYAISITGTTAQFNGETIGHFTTEGSQLDLSDLNPASLTATFAENAAGTSGQLSLSDGVHATTVTLIGQLAPDSFSGSAAAAGFSFAADSGAGTAVTWH